MKIIDLLNKIANGEINEDIEIEYQNGYNFEYCNIRNFFDRYIVDKENLNQEIKLVKSLEEENKIPEKINNWISNVGRVDDSNIEEYIHKLFEQQTILYFKINSIIDYFKSKGE